MSSRLRRSLVLTTLLALLLGVSGVAALIGLPPPHRTPRCRHRRRCDDDPELQELMDSRRMNAVQLTNFYSGASASSTRRSMR